MTTKAFTTGSSLFTETCTEGAEIGLFITDGNQYSRNIGSFLYENVRSKATRTPGNKIEWIQDPEVFLLSKRPIIIFAYYPYLSQNPLNPTLIPICISPIAVETPDYKYGTLSQGQKEVSSLSPIAKVSMKYALSLISFEVYIMPELQSKFNLTSIQIGNVAGGNSLQLKGAMDVTTGMIKGIPSPYRATRLTIDTPSILHQKQAEEYSIRIIPTYIPLGSKSVEFLFTINGKTYRYALPKGVCWKKGYKYLYTFLFTGNEMILSGVTSHLWTPSTLKNSQATKK